MSCGLSNMGTCVSESHWCFLSVWHECGVLYEVSMHNSLQVNWYGLFSKLVYQVKVKIWVDGAEGSVLGGLTARFGGSLPTEAKDGTRFPAVFTNPSNCCSNSSSKVYLVLLIEHTSAVLTLSWTLQFYVIIFSILLFLCQGMTRREQLNFQL